MKCEICNLGPANGVTLFRQNPKGEVGRWRCRAHTDVQPPPEVERLTDIIEGRNDDPE